MPKAIKASDLALFQCYLIGTWSNKGVPKAPGGKPLSFNVMPLPQEKAHPPTRPHFEGYILKNFTFTEKIKFHGSVDPHDPPQHQELGAIATTASAPNRGGDYSQIVQAVFYDQQVRFAEGPKGVKNSVVHVENGAWLYLKTVRQQKGPYSGPPVSPKKPPPQPPYITIAKQIAVPHGNSVLALGNFDITGTTGKGKAKQPNPVLVGPPVIADAFPPYPEPPSLSAYPYQKTLVGGPGRYENPNPAWTWNSNQPLQIAVKKLKPTHHMHWRVTTSPLAGEHGEVTNIPFEQRRANVTAYWADYWMLSTNNYKSFDYLAYTQTILMEMLISLDKGKTVTPYVFPHVTSNTVKRE